MRRIVRGALAGAALLLSASALAQQNFDDVEIQVIPLASGIHMLVGAGGNLAVSSGPDGVFLVDDQFAPLTDKIRAAIATLSDGPLRFVLNTHWHSDHTGGNENLGKAGALIVAHDRVRTRLSVDQFMEAFGRVPASPPEALPVITFGQDVTFHLNGHDVHVFHVESAHTDGDSIVHFRGANVIHMGDTFWSSRYPFIDLGTGGSIDGTIAAAERVLSLSDENTRIVPGHGPLSDRADLERYRDMLAAIRDRVKSAVEAGGDLAAVLAAKPSADFDAVWETPRMDGEGFVRSVYASLTE